MTLFLIIFGFFIGASFGSFASALIWRLPRNIPWIYDEQKEFVRSKCPSCHQTLGQFDLIPVFSWVLYRGKCRMCQSEIGIIYPLLEVFGGLCAAMFFLFLGFTTTSIFLFLCFFFLFIFSFVGFVHGMWVKSIMGITAFFGIVALIFLVFTGF